MLKSVSFKKGHCKHGELCQNKQVEKKCTNFQCSRMNCDFRHQKILDTCSYEHVKNNESKEATTALSDLKAMRLQLPVLRLQLPAQDL